MKTTVNDITFEVLDGNFYEGEYLTLSVNGKIIKRKVYYSKDAGDLYFMYKNSMYFLCDFY